MHPPQPFFSIMLIEGRIEVHVNSGDGTSLRKALLHAPTGSYGDGQEHSISVVRNRRYLSSQVFVSGGWDEGAPLKEPCRILGVILDGGDGSHDVISNHGSSCFETILGICWNSTIMSAFFCFVVMFWKFFLRILTKWMNLMVNSRLVSVGSILPTAKAIKLAFHVFPSPAGDLCLRHTGCFHNRIRGVWTHTFALITNRIQWCIHWFYSSVLCVGFTYDAMPKFVSRTKIY